MAGRITHAPLPHVRKPAMCGERERLSPDLTWVSATSVPRKSTGSLHRLVKGKLKLDASVHSVARGWGLGRVLVGEIPYMSCGGTLQRFEEIYSIYIGLGGGGI